MHFIEKAHICHRVWRYRLRTERREIAYLLSRDLRGATVADIGANRGAYSYWMHKAVGSQGHVIAFEPQPELVQYLGDVKNSFGLKQLTVVATALSSASGERTLHRAPNHWGGASLELEHNCETERLTVATTTLDDYLLDSPLRPLRFIKADIQGHELACFRGGYRILTEDRPEILCESLDTEFEQLHGYLAGLDYRGFFFHHGALTPVTELDRVRSSIAAPYLNFVFVPDHQRPTETGRCNA